MASSRKVADGFAPTCSGQPIHPGAGYGHPVRKSRWSKVVLICAALGVAATAGVVAVRRGGSDGGPDASAATVSAPTTAPGTQKTTTQTPSPEPTGPTATVVPLAEETRTVVQNPLYKVGRIPPSRCKEPSARPTSVAKVKIYYIQFLGCLNKAWAPVMKEAGFRFWALQLQVYLGKPHEPGLQPHQYRGVLQRRHLHERRLRPEEPAFVRPAVDQNDDGVPDRARVRASRAGDDGHPRGLPYPRGPHHRRRCASGRESASGVAGVLPEWGLPRR